MWLKLLAGKLERATRKSGGYDIFSTERVIIPPGEHRRIMTGVVTEFEDGWVALMRDKSKLSLNYGITTLGGVIDGDYPDEWSVILLNTGKEPVIFEIGNKLTNVLFVRLAEITPHPDALCVELGPTAQFITRDTVRTGGFGSTGAS